VESGCRPLPCLLREQVSRTAPLTPEVRKF
jgi:hypothetical protein